MSRGEKSREKEENLEVSMEGNEEATEQTSSSIERRKMITRARRVLASRECCCRILVELSVVELQEMVE